MQSSRLFYPIVIDTSLFLSHIVAQTGQAQTTKTSEGPVVYIDFINMDA